MRLLLLLPITIPFLTAVVSLLAWKRRTAQRALSVIGAAGLFASAVALLADIWRNGIQSVQIGNWPAPFGITLVADLFSSIMVVMAGMIGLAGAVYSLGSMDHRRESFGYYPLVHILLMGVCGSFLTGDIFNLYVWFEVMLISSFVLMELGGEKAQLEGAIKYVTLNLMSSALFLTAVGILYGITGTLNMADVAIQLRGIEQSGMVTTIAVLFLLAFGIKAGIFPLFFWLPASYHTPPASVSAIFAGLLTKVGVYALIRLFTLLFVHDTSTTHTLILAVAGLTMVTGVLGAVAQNEFRRILSFHIISQIGYMIMGLGLFTRLALAGSVFFICHNIIVKTSLFLVSGVVHRLRGTYELKRLGGLYRSFPALTILFMIAAMSIAGMPPLSGFWGKFVLLKAGVETGDYAIVSVALVVSLLTLFSMTKIWNQVFWKEAPSTANEEVEGPGDSRKGHALFFMLLPIVLLAILTVIIGLATQPFLALTLRAADQLINPVEYINAVLGGL